MVTVQNAHILQDMNRLLAYKIDCSPFHSQEEADSNTSGSGVHDRRTAAQEDINGSQ